MSPIAVHESARRMANKPKLLSEQLREAIDAADVSRYRIAKDIGVTEALLSRFMNGVGHFANDSWLELWH